jgi:hypothetical protein
LFSHCPRAEQLTPGITPQRSQRFGIPRGERIQRRVNGGAFGFKELQDKRPAFLTPAPQNVRGSVSDTFVGIAQRFDQRFADRFTFHVSQGGDRGAPDDRRWIFEGVKDGSGIEGAIP